MATFAEYDFVSPLPHPGEILREDFMAPLEMTAWTLAKRMGLKGRSRIERLVREDGPITPDTALRLEGVFKMDAQFWMNLQTQHDLSKALIEKRAEYRTIEAVAV